jgi:hypothetical protein
MGIKGWVTGLGYPTTDDKGSPDGVGRYNHFSGKSGASIYFTPSTGRTPCRASSGPSGPP